MKDEFIKAMNEAKETLLVSYHSSDESAAFNAGADWAYSWLTSLKEYCDDEYKKEVGAWKLIQRLEEERGELKSENKFSGKYYALYHWILIDLGIEKPFERNSFKQI